MRKLYLILCFMVCLTVTLVFLPQARAVDGGGKPLATNYVTVDFTFTVGQAQLPQDAKGALDQKTREIRQSGKIVSAIGAVWSDEPLPKRGEKLQKEQTQLARERMERVRESLAELGVQRIRLINMAKPSNALAKLFKTRGAEVKSSIAKKGTEQPINEEDFAISQRGGPSRAVITFEVLPSGS